MILPCPTLAVPAPSQVLPVAVPVVPGVYPAPVWFIQLPVGCSELLGDALSRVVPGPARWKLSTPGSHQRVSQSYCPGFVWSSSPEFYRFVSTSFCECLVCPSMQLFLLPTPEKHIWGTGKKPTHPQTRRCFCSKCAVRQEQRGSRHWGLSCQSSRSHRCPVGRSRYLS